MTIESVAIESLSADPANARKHGQQKPIVVDSHGVVRAGNGQLAAARALGWTHIRVVRSDLPSTELTAFAIADNRTGELAEWDAEVLAGLLSNPELGDVGFTDEEIERLADTSGESRDGDNGDIQEMFEVVAECRDERQQKELFEKLTAEGYSCRLFTL